MSKNLKRAISMLLAVVMVLGLLPAMAFAADTYTATLATGIPEGKDVAIYNASGASVFASGFSGGSIVPSAAVLENGTLTVKEAVAETKGIKYAALQEALEAATNGETVTLLKDVVYGESDIVNAIGGPTGYGQYPNPSIIYIGGTEGKDGAANQPSAVNAVLDLNGHSITNNADAYLFLIMDNAKLTIKDSKNGAGIIGNSNAPVLWSTGTDTVVTIESGKYTVGDYGSLMWATHSGDLVINGGEFSTTADDASQLIMRNEKDRQNSKFFISGKSTVTVYGGTFHGFDPEKMYDDSKDPAYQFNAVAEGYMSKETSKNVWEVKKAVDFGMVAKIVRADKTVYFETAAAGLSAAADGETVIMIADSTEGMIYVEPEKTLDLNGKTLTASYVVAFGNGAIMDAEEGNGLLKITSGSSRNVILNAANGQMALYDNTDGGYRFFTMTIEIKTPTHDASINNVKFQVRPAFTNLKAYELLAAQGASGSKIEFAIDLTWEGKTSAPQRVLFVENLIVENSEYEAGGRKRAYNMNIKGVDILAGKTLTGTAVMVSETGTTVIGEAMNAEIK